MDAVERHSLSFWDAMLWAMASRAGCRVLFSEDLQDGCRLDGVPIVDPFAAANRKLVDLALAELPRSRSESAALACRARRQAAPAGWVGALFSPGESV